MIIPPFLKTGDKIGITAPARFIEQEKYPDVLNIFEKQGYKIVRGKTTYLEHGPFAGTDEDRAADLQAMLDDENIKAIFCLRGGYGTIRIIDHIDFERFKKHPKWIIGFSDITILHNVLHNLGFVSVHGQMPLNFSGRNENKGLDKLFEVLQGEILNYNLPVNNLNRIGVCSGQLIGGNVAILSSLIGTPFDIDTNGKILFIEDVGEYLYRFDRLMHHLKMSGKLKKLSGLIIGGLSDMKDNDPTFPQTAQHIVADMVKEYSYPVCFDFPAGHIKENYPLVLGSQVYLEVTEQASTISFNNEPA